MKDAILSYFLNTFDPELQKDSLYPLVSSSPLDESISTSLLSVKENGIKFMKDFEERLSGNSEKRVLFTNQKFRSATLPIND